MRHAFRFAVAAVVVGTIALVGVRKIRAIGCSSARPHPSRAQTIRCRNLWGHAHSVRTNKTTDSYPLHAITFQISVGGPATRSPFERPDRGQRRLLCQSVASRDYPEPSFFGGPATFLNKSDPDNQNFRMSARRHG